MKTTAPGPANSNHMDRRFLRSYIGAALITGLNTFFLVVPVIILILPYVGTRKGYRRIRLAYFVSIVFGGFFALCFTLGVTTLASVKSLSDFEGPNGAGSPIAPIFGLSYLTLLFVIPWTIAVMRGYQASRDCKQTEQCADGKTPEADQPPHELNPNTRLP